MLIKFLSKKVVENLIKEATKQLPDLAEKIKQDLLAHKDEFLQSAFDFVKSAVVEFIKKRFGK